MRIATRSLVLLSLLLAAPALVAQGPPARSAKFDLTIDNIMRGPDLVGYAPDNLRWSADSQKLYFEWRKPGEDDASTYWVARDGGTPSRLDDAQKKTVPPANGRWDKARKRVVFAERGDIVMLDAAGTQGSEDVVMGDEVAGLKGFGHRWLTSGRRRRFPSLN